MFNFDVINFKSEPKKTFFAPEWDYYLFENINKKIKWNKVADLIKSKEKEILKLPLSGSGQGGYTGLKKNSTTFRYDSYNVLKWKNKNIELVKELIIRLHNQALLYFKQPLAKELYAKCWVNIMRKGDMIKPHLHCTTPESYLGGHICVQTEGTSTHYINPINQINDPEIYTSKNEVGKITLFQSNIPHYTDKVSKGERITIAFDLFLEKKGNNNIRLI
tara:strand:+ start:309 stop:965 length:657 start_codon:yes stop_codon:yes gene_type:complete